MLLIKIGGGQETNFQQISADISNFDEKIIFVHGGNVARDQLAQNLGFPTKRIISPSGVTSVYTDIKAIEILTMAYAGLVNKKWVAHFIKNGIKAVGLSGADGQLLVGQRKEVLISQEKDKKIIIRDTYTGQVKSVNTHLLQILLLEGYLPVITQPGVTSDGVLINTDNDLNCALIAAEMGIRKMVVLFEAPGMLRNVKDESSVIRRISKNELPHILQYAGGTMKKKVLGAMAALENGVQEIYWGDSRIQNPISKAIAGQGTVIS